MKSIAEVQAEIVEEFEMLEEWPDKYQYIIDLGKELPDFTEAEQTEENKVRGCQSNVWLISNVEDDKIYFRGDSDALIVKGLVALLLRVFSGHTPDEILDSELYFMDKIGLQAHLSHTRNNGLAAMIKQIRFYAVAYRAKMNQTQG